MKETFKITSTAHKIYVITVLSLSDLVEIQSYKKVVFLFFFKNKNYSRLSNETSKHHFLSIFSSARVFSLRLSDKKMQKDKTFHTQQSMALKIYPDASYSFNCEEISCRFYSSSDIIFHLKNFKSSLLC